MAQETRRETAVVHSWSWPRKYIKGFIGRTVGSPRRLWLLDCYVHPGIPPGYGSEHLFARCSATFPSVRAFFSFPPCARFYWSSRSMTHFLSLAYGSTLKNLTLAIRSMCIKRVWRTRLVLRARARDVYPAYIFIVAVRKTVNLPFVPFVLFGKVEKDVSAGWRLVVLYVDEYVRLRSLTRARCIYVTRVCQYVRMHVYEWVFPLHLYMRLKYKCGLVSETASELARSSSVDVLDVRLGVYTLSPIIVSETELKQTGSYIPPS